MARDADEEEIREFLQKSLGYDVPEDRNNARAVLNVSSEANEETFEKIRRDKDMGEAMRRIMRDDLEQAEKDGEQNAVVQAIRNLMETMKWTIEQAMDALKIPSDQRAIYAGMIDKK